MTTVAQARFREWQERYEAWTVRRERKRTVAMLLRLAAIKFGTQTADSLTAILGTNPSAERMERVGVAIMECDSGEELLARCSEAEA